MKTNLKRLMIVLLVLVLMTSTAVSKDIFEMIQVKRDAVQLIVNGRKIDAPNFVYMGTTYVPIRAVADAIGGTTTWDQPTLTAGIVTNGPTTQTNVTKLAVDAYNPVIPLKNLQMTSAMLELVAIRKEGVLLPMMWELKGETIIFTTPQSLSGKNVLDFNANYSMDVYKTDGTKINVTLVSSGLPTQLKVTNERQVIYIPATPEKGFNWPYYLVIPGTNHAGNHQNETSKKYLLVEGINNGSDSSYGEYTNKLIALKGQLEKGQSNGLDIASPLMMPYLMPLIARPNIVHYLNNEENAFYTHALDRDTAIIDTLLSNISVGPKIKNDLIQQGYNPDDFKGITGQIAKMIDHALTYLNSQGFGLEKKVMMYGYSAQGTFDDRFATLYPNLVKAYASGGTTDDLILPLASHSNEKLIFPIGVSDYKAITGREFSLTQHNGVARLLFMGEKDTNNVVPYSDCYGELERKLIIKLWGLDVLPRAQKLTQLYGASGGEGVFVIDKGIGHGFSYEMREYVIEFIKANRAGVEPVYPKPAATNQLDYTIFQ